MDLIILEGKTQREAAKAIGMNETSLSRALKIPHVQEVFEQEKQAFLTEREDLKGRAQKLAIHEGVKLLREAKSESVRAKMVEFFAGDAVRQGPSVTVNTTVNTGNVPGYAVIPPGASIIDITPAQSDDE